MRTTPFDAETVMMLRGLTQRESFITELDNNFTIHAFYSNHPDPDYISAVIDAVRGRMGERFIEVDDNPEMQMLKFTIAYDKHNLPDIEGFTDVVPAEFEKGDLYFCKPNMAEDAQIRAIQVRRDNWVTVAMFCGNGTIQTERHLGGKAWFTFLNNGTYVDVPENDYIVRRQNANAFEKWKKADFEKVWKIKN